MSLLRDASPEGGGLRILLVDDDPSMARLVQQILLAHGFSAPTHVTTGGAALAAAEGVDVVLLDQELPDVTGLDLCRRVSRERPQVQLVVTAAGRCPTDVPQGARVLRKPYATGELQTLVAKPLLAEV